MTCKIYKPCCSSLCNKFFVDGICFFCISFFCQERNIHQRTAAFFNSSMVNITAVQIIIKQVCLCTVKLFHSLCATIFFNPGKDFTHYINSIARRSIEHGTFICMSFIIKHCRSSFHWSFRNQIIPNDYQSNTCRSKIFLRTCINNAKF